MHPMEVPDGNDKEHISESNTGRNSRQEEEGARRQYPFIGHTTLGNSSW